MPLDTAEFLEMPPALQRTRGEGRLTIAGARVRELYQLGAAKIRLPNAHGAHAQEAVLINTGGGLTGGDRMAWRVAAEDGAHLTVTTQACEKVYRSTGGPAHVDTALDIGPGAAIDWLPQETILFDRAELARTLEADIAEGGRLLALESVVLGRQAMGETVRQGSLRDRWRVRRQGRLIFADDIRLDGAMADLAARPAALAGGRAFATLLLVEDEAERLLEPVRAALAGRGGASAFGGKLTCRIVAADGLTLRRALLPALQALRQDAPLPRVWSL
ncbi:MAG: urease accessory protein UreD [Caulobacter sp.]|nr:urease accessory protein UreD [Caulobacter sp.]